MSLYNRVAAMLVRLIVTRCTSRKRYVDYVHPAPGGGERTYMRRYVLFGYRTGDAPQRGWRARLPNLYLHRAAITKRGAISCQGAVTCTKPSGIASSGRKR